MNIAENVVRVRERLEAACRRSGRSVADVRLMGVSKFHDVSALNAAWAAGLRLFGESRVQEAAGKFPAFRVLHPDLQLHLIGNLQRNKAKVAVELFDCVQSVDRDDLIIALEKRAAECGTVLPVLLELHTGEASKSGYPDREALFRATDLVLSAPSLRLQGLMTMAPFSQDEALVRHSFRVLREVRDSLARRYPDADWSTLSMGMSNDFELAIEEGATLVRVGTAIFGPPQP